MSRAYFAHPLDRLSAREGEQSVVSPETADDPRKTRSGMLKFMRILTNIFKKVSAECRFYVMLRTEKRPRAAK